MNLIKKLPTTFLNYEHAIVQLQHGDSSLIYYIITLFFNLNHPENLVTRTNIKSNYEQYDLKIKTEGT